MGQGDSNGQHQTGVITANLPSARFFERHREHWAPIVAYSITSSAAQRRQNAKYHAVQIVKLGAVRHD